VGMVVSVFCVGCVGVFVVCCWFVVCVSGCYLDGASLNIVCVWCALLEVSDVQKRV